MKTTIHFYRYNIADSKDAQEYDLLCKHLREDRRLFDCISHKPHALAPHHTSQPITLKTDTFFDNQWNSEEFGRVFDWYEDININNRNLKYGHYLTITQEMIDLRNNTYKCGYCGRYSDPADIYCHKCLSSEYLTERELDLLALRPVATPHYTPILPIDAAIELKEDYAIAQRARLREKAQKLLIKTAEEQRKYLNDSNIDMNINLHFLNNCVDTDNLIYYRHTKTACYGWRQAITKEEADKIVSKIKPINFNLEFKLNDGTTYTCKV